MEPCLEAKSNTLSYSWGGAFRAGILFSTLWRGCYQSLYVTENYVETREALTAVLSFFSSAKCNFLPAHEALLTAGYSKGEKEAWPPKPPKEMSVSKGSEYYLHVWDGTPGFPVHHQLPKLTQTHVHRVSDAISSSVVPFSSHLQSFPASGSFQMSQFFISGGQSIGASASASVLPVNIQDWLPLGWTGWISLQDKGFSRVFSNTTAQKHQFVGTKLSL